MKNFGFLGSSALRSAAFMSFAALAAAPAYAQDAPADPATLQSEPEVESGTDAQAAAEGETITITGSRIRRPNLESTIPITSVGGEEFFQTGKVAIGDVLNDLPQLRTTLGQSNSTRFLGTSGLNLLDLRGLGTVRTLVLVNSRRHVGGDVLNTGVSVDTNTIPTDLIERVDVVTGGNSAIYGSDAIAGVVNFILKKDFDGIQLRGQGGVSKYGDAGAYFGSLLVGRNFADGRGNIAVNAEYAHQNQYFGDQRPSLRNNMNFVIVDTDPAGIPNGSDGSPDRVFIRDIVSATIANTGLVAIRVPTASPRCGLDPLGAAFSCNFLFQPDGTLVPQTGTHFGVGPQGVFIGGNGDRRRLREELQLSPNLDRYNVNLIGHFTISDALEPFVEAKYSRTNSAGTGSSGPAFVSGSTLDAFYERPRLDNPYLAPAARQLIASNILLSGLNPNNGAALSAAQIAAVNSGSFRFPLRLNMRDLSIRREEATRETYRAVVGVRGDFNDDWQYELSGNYGKLRERTKVLGNMNYQRFLLAMDAIRDSSGQIVCGSKVDPTRANLALTGGPDLAGNPAVLAADIAACVPVNPFGGRFTDAQRAYLLQDTTSQGKITQFVVNAFLSGDSSDWFELPGGPVGFAVGAEYRRDTLAYNVDPIVEAGYTFYNAIPTFAAPAAEVKELFGEIRLPLLSDMPFFHELTLSAAGRAADYKGKTGTVFAYNAGIDWAPVPDLRLRGNYSRAVRAPNVGDLYTPLGQNFSTVVDPCSLNNIGTGTATREANCRAAGIPATYNFNYLQSLEFRSGGNPDLQAETATSWTFGGVVQPRAMPGFSASLDYFDITVDDVITAPAAQQILNACYDAPSLANQFCALFQRAGSAGQGTHAPFQIIEGSLQQVALNYAQLRARGIDAEVAYRHSIEEFGQVNTRFVYTHMLQRDNFLDPANPAIADQFLLELGDPKDAFNWNIDVKTGPVNLGYQLRYIGKMVTNLYEDFFSKQGRAPQNADWSEPIFYPSVVYHNARIDIEAGNEFNFYIGVDNFMNKLPPLGLTGIGGGSGIYDNRGRFFYSGVKARF